MNKVGKVMIALLLLLGLNLSLAFQGQHWIVVWQNYQGYQVQGCQQLPMIRPDDKLVEMLPVDNALCSESRIKLQLRPYLRMVGNDKYGREQHRYVMEQKTLKKLLFLTFNK